MSAITVRYISFPDIENGISSFYAHTTDKKCVEPNIFYSNGGCHTIGKELDELAHKVGFISREMFALQHHSSSWKNDYAKELSYYIGKELELRGISWGIGGRDILFKCPKGEFITWPRVRNIK